MKSHRVFVLLCIVMLQHCTNADISASDVMKDIYRSCISQYSTSCVKPKALAWISQSIKNDEIKINNELYIIRTSEDVLKAEERSVEPTIALFDKIDSFLSTHALRVQAPEILKTEARAYVPEALLKDGLTNGLVIPLVQGNAAEGRGFVKKVMIPFLLGLKFKSTVLVPIALVMIALKTWKAMTMGLLSLVLTGAMVIFKFAKPKIVNYEVVHYPHPIEHHVAPPHHHHQVPWEPQPGWARQLDGQESAYNAYL